MMEVEEGDQTMSEDAEVVSGLPVEETVITRNVVAMAMSGGLAGTVLMLPIVVLIPQVLGVFETSPITDFAGFAAFFGVEPTVMLGATLFGLGGMVALPLVFLVFGAFLPPVEQRHLRGVTFGTIFWVGFALAFLPDGGAVTVGSFLVFSLLGHWVYGLMLGTALDRTTGIPQHEV
jgi:MFS family permease